MLIEITKCKNKIRGTRQRADKLQNITTNAHHLGYIKINDSKRLLFNLYAAAAYSYMETTKEVWDSLSNHTNYLLENWF